MYDLFISIVFLVVVIGFLSTLYIFGAEITQTDHVLIIFVLLFLYLIYLLCLYSPLKTEIDNEISYTKKKYDKYKKEAEDFYTDQIKATWTTALNDRNKYYFFVLISLIYLPVPIYVIYLWRQVLITNEMFDITLSLILLALSAFITTLIGIYVYGLNIQYILIPVFISFLFVLYYF
jgi:hypothetical protein